MLCRKNIAKNDEKRAYKKALTGIFFCLANESKKCY
jgi:hypothetical protein